jgi:hypothetical protein
VAINQPPPGPPPPSVAPAPPAPAPAPPINLKYYGFKIMKADGRTMAFLTDGDEIVFAEENQTLKQRYKIVRITRTNIVIEDTQAKSTQTLAIQETPS